MPQARISLTLYRHFSLSFIASGRSSGPHPVSSYSCWMYVRAGRPAFAWPYVGVHRSTSLISSSLLLQHWPACLVCLTRIVFVMGGRWPYSWCLVGCCRQVLFNIARSILGHGYLSMAVFILIPRSHSYRWAAVVPWSNWWSWALSRKTHVQKGNKKLYFFPTIWITIFFNPFTVQGKLEVTTDIFSQDFILYFIWLSKYVTGNSHIWLLKQWKDSVWFLCLMAYQPL